MQLQLTIVFSYETFTESPHATKIKTWSQALAIFIQVGGKAAPFLSKCLNVGMAAYKFRTLPSHLLNAAYENCENLQLQNPPLPTKWLPFLPLETSFPSDVYISHCWDLSQAAARIHELNMAVRTNHHCDATVIRITTADFDAINECTCYLHNSPLDGSWRIPVVAHKRLPPPWIDLVLRYRSDPAAGFTHIKCITQVCLATWQAMTAAEIRMRIPGAMLLYRGF